MKKKASHLQIIALGYFLMIALGTVLLMLPAASKAESASFGEALFTATSASCVTGLVVRDTGTAWSLFGQVVIILLIQVGGLGFMTIASAFYRLMRRRIGLRERELLVESLNTSHVGGIMAMTHTILKGTALIEGGGALLLAVRFVPLFGPAKGIWYSVFHSISAFCNAGFDLLGAEYGEYCSLVPFVGDPVVNIAIMLLITLGGIGFFVWDDVTRNGLKLRSYALHTKLTLTVSAILTFGGAILFFLLESGEGMTAGTRVLAALFDSVTPRTAGFNTTDIASLSPGGKILTIILMFIGGSSGSTAGGIKTTTVAVIVLFAWSQMRRQQTNTVFHREIEQSALSKAVTVFTVNLFIALAGAVFICAVQTVPLDHILLETFSAIGTVGMSTGLTRELIPFSRYVIVFMMFCGRVGSVSFALAMLGKKARPPIRYPHEQITVG